VGVEEPVAVIAILLLVIKELISFLKERSNEKKTWDGNERRTGVSVEEVNNSIQLLVLPILAKQTEILVALEKLSRENAEKMFTNLHNLNGDAQTAIGVLQNIQDLVQRQASQKRI